MSLNRIVLLSSSCELFFWFDFPAARSGKCERIEDRFLVSLLNVGCPVAVRLMFGFASGPPLSFSLEESFSVSRRIDVRWIGFIFLWG